MSDLKKKLIEVIAAKVITEGHMTNLPLPKEFGTLRWTGWKEVQMELYPHAQIVWLMERQPNHPRRVYYVDLPSMNHGSILNGECFSIGFSDKSHYINEHTTVEEIREWFKEGFSLLMDDVLNDNPWLLENPMKRSSVQHSQ